MAFIPWKVDMTVAIEIYGNFIGGEWIGGANSAKNINPSDTGDVIAEYARADARQAGSAVEAATHAQPLWAKSTPQQRFDALDAIGSEILARQSQLGDLLAREEGKTLPEAIGEVVRAGQIFKFFAGEAMRSAGELIPSQERA
jgi:alpha-ketoglutaric semialdehyde dehydrogenase